MEMDRIDTKDGAFFVDRDGRHIPVGPMPVKTPAMELAELFHENRFMLDDVSRRDLTRFYAERYVRRYNGMVAKGVIQGSPLNETEFEATLREAYKTSQPQMQR